MKMKYKIFFFIGILLIFSFSLNSCRLFLPEDEGPGEIETEDTIGDVTEEPGTAEGDPESSQITENESEEEEKETPQATEESEEEKDIIVDSPLPNQVISSPLVITGEARGTWFFEANFPVRLLDGNGEEITVYYAQALDEWMTEDFVPFQSEIEFEKPETGTGFLILEKNNPSDMREHDDEIIIPVRFE